MADCGFADLNRDRNCDFFDIILNIAFILQFIHSITLMHGLFNKDYKSHQSKKCLMNKKQTYISCSGI